jgi:hypothetical protein
MKEKSGSGRRRSNPKSILRLPDLEPAKATVLNTLNSADAKRGYGYAIDEFVDWYCSEPRLRCHSHLESHQLFPENHKSASWRRASARIRSGRPRTSAGIRRIKGWNWSRSNFFGTCFGAIDRTLAWLQTANSITCQ